MPLCLRPAPSILTRRRPGDKGLVPLGGDLLTLQGEESAVDSASSARFGRVAAGHAALPYGRVEHGRRHEQALLPPRFAIAGDSEKTEADGDHDGIVPGADAQLPVDVLEVGLHRVL